jgi:VWFA-related protein
MGVLLVLLLVGGPLDAGRCAVPCQRLSGQVVQQSEGASAVQGASPPSRPIRLDVIAVDGAGRIPEGLKPTDFELTEDGIPQTLDDARLIRVGRGQSGEAEAIQSAADERAEGGRDDVRLFAVFLDEYHVEASDSPRVREAVRRFIADTLGPRDLVVVMRPLDPLLAIRLRRGSDEAARAIDRFQGRKGDYAPRNDYERDYFAGTPARIEQLRNQVATSALNALALHLGSLNRDMRKTLVVVSEGLARVEHRLGLEALPTFDWVIRAANRSNVSVYAVDPREVIVDRAAVPTPNVLDAIAVATGGRSIASTGELAVAMRPIADDSGLYYLLTYRSGQKARTGFHEVRVGIKRAGISLRARSGYWTMPSEDGLRAIVARSSTPIAVGPPRRISPLIQPWFGASRGVDGKTRVTFVWEPATRVPGDRTRQSPAARVVIKALDAKGGTLFEGLVRPTGAVRTDRPGEDMARAVFEAPPGSLRLQMSIQDATSQAIDSDVRDITVRDLTARVALGTPEVLRARTARDFRSIENDPDAAPVVAREFSRTERLIVRVPAYGPPGVPVTVTSKLLSRSGQVMRGLDVRAAASERLSNQIDVPLAPLAAGEYLLEVTATCSAGDATERMPFRVTN